MRDERSYKLSELFKFEERDITRHMLYEMHLAKKFKESFNYIKNKLEIQETKFLSEAKWDEGKNYSWAVFKRDDLYLIIRKYRSHFTIFFKNENKKSGFTDSFEDYCYTKYGCFTYSTDRDKLNDESQDMYCENNFIDMDETFEDMLKLLEENKIHSIWNPHSFKRPKHVDVKIAWTGGNEDIASLETFIFACDELFNKHLELFAQTDMLEKIKTFKIGDKLNGYYTVLDIRTDVKNEYFHGVGMELGGTNGPDSKSWEDVYSLTRYYFDAVFS